MCPCHFTLHIMSKRIRQDINTELIYQQNTNMNVKISSETLYKLEAVVQEILSGTMEHNIIISRESADAIINLYRNINFVEPRLDADTDIDQFFSCDENSERSRSSSMTSTESERSVTLNAKLMKDLKKKTTPNPTKKQKVEQGKKMTKKKTTPKTKEKNCVVCDKTAGYSSTTWNNMSFHCNCFNCFGECGRNMSRTSELLYIGKDDEMPYCKTCFESKYSPKCEVCGKSAFHSVSYSKIGSVHRECLVCSSPGCEKPIEHGRFYIRNDGNDGLKKLRCMKHMSGSDSDFKSTPSPLSKPLVARDSSKYSIMDEWAKTINVSSIQQFQSAFMYRFGSALDEELKARVVFIFIAYHIRYKAYNPRRSQKAETVIQTGEAVCEGYANLFKELCTSINVDSVKIVGLTFSKEMLDNPQRSKSLVESSGHAWNGLKLGKYWYLIDSCWGAGTVKNGVFKQSLNDFYFKAPPEQFIYSHFPDDTKWQLMKTTYSWEQFVALPKLKPAFFDNCLKLNNYKQKVISLPGPAGDTTAKIELEAPSSLSISASLHLPDDLSETKFKNCVYVHRQDNSDAVTVFICPPGPGTFELSLFVKEFKSTEKAKYMCSYIVEANCASKNHLPSEISSDFDQSLCTLVRPRPNKAIQRGPMNVAISFRNPETKAVCARVLNLRTMKESDRIPLIFNKQTMQFEAILPLSTADKSTIDIYWARPGQEDNAKGTMYSLFKLNTV